MSSSVKDLSWYKMSRSILPGFMQTTEGDLCGQDRWSLCAGVPIQSWKSTEAFLRCTKATSSGNPTDVLCDHLGVYVFSQRLVSAMTRYSCRADDIELLPVSVYDFQGERCADYFVVNFLKVLLALDRDRTFMLDISEKESDPATGQPKVLGIGRPAVFGDSLDGHDLVCLREFRPIRVASRNFKNAYESIDGTGLSFNPIMVNGEYA